MRQKKRKQIGILFGAVLVAGVFAGCQKVGEDTLTPTQTAVLSATAEPTRQTETEQAVTPEPVIFPVAINEINFPEKLLQKKAIAADTDGDNRLRREEAETVTKLHLKKFADSKDDVEGPPWPEYTKEDFSFDFEGIQYFTELSELKVNLLGGEVFVAGHSMEDEILATTKNFSRIYECRNLKKMFLYEIDVVSLDCSVFPNLKRLELNGMYNLESLEVGKLEMLSALWVSECHRLERLDVSGLGKLKTLDVVRNDCLKAIVLGKENLKLETIQLNGLPGLAEAEFSSLSHLKSLNLMEVGLTCLDVSKNSELEQLCAEGLRLDTLDLSRNGKIRYLINAKDSFRKIVLPEENCIDMIRWTDSAVTEFPVEGLNPETLTGIDIQGTVIKELDVSRYPNLEYLYYDEDVTKIIR